MFYSNDVEPTGVLNKTVLDEYMIIIGVYEDSLYTIYSSVPLVNLTFLPVSCENIWYITVSECFLSYLILTLKVPITTGADDIQKYFIIVFFRENKT